MRMRRLVCLLALACSLFALAANAAVPAVPHLTVQSNFCFGSNDIIWTAVSGATYYELWGSNYTNFTPQSVWYSGPFTSHSTTTAALPTTYFHVRACNTGGCSAFSNTGVARYYNGCQ